MIGTMNREDISRVLRNIRRVVDDLVEGEGKGGSSQYHMQGDRYEVEVIHAGYTVSIKVLEIDSKEVMTFDNFGKAIFKLNELRPVKAPHLSSKPVR